MRLRSDVLSSATAIGYVRVSKEDQQLSPGAQVDAINTWSAHNAIPVTRIYQDLGVSGATPADERHGLSAALLAVETQEADFLVVSARDRLSRDMLQTMLIERHLSGLAKPCRVVTAVEDPQGSATPETVMLSQIVDSFAQYELSKIRSRTKEGVRKAREQGRVAGPKKLETYARGQRSIQLIKRLRETLKPTQIVAWLGSRGIFTPHRAAFTHQHIRACLASEYPAADLDYTAESLAQAVLALPYYESAFVKGSAAERARVRG
jgi:putative DNA-invertase from lambdoid prophage Rac